jgi:hypothetical protein
MRVKIKINNKVDGNKKIFDWRVKFNKNITVIKKEN